MSSPQPDPQHVIKALSDELHAANDNRIYLIAVLNQLQTEFNEARELWSLERESLVKANHPEG